MLLIKILLILLYTNQLFAYQLSPMSFTFSPKISSHYFVISNDSDKKEAIQITIAKRVMDLSGNEKHPEIEDVFMVYPDQLILKPNERRKIKVQRLSKNTPEIEQAYRLITEQLPINLKKKSDRKVKTSINLLLRYIASVYIAPMSPKKSFKLVKTIVKNNKLNLTIKNSGNTHILLKELKVKLSSLGANYTYSAKELKSMKGENILAGNSRKFILPFPKKMHKTKYKVGINFDMD